MIHHGACHCGELKVSFQTDKTPDELGVRACQCSFCTRQKALNISDGEGSALIEADEGQVNRYAFGLRTADFLICKTCGTYIAAVIGEGDRIRSTLNVVGLRMEAFSCLEPAPMVYEEETTEARIARRFKVWTPTKFSDPTLGVAHFGPHTASYLS
ncbi:MAG: aldehyde-activating protein [Pseudomonadota bacterium]